MFDLEVRPLPPVSVPTRTRAFIVTAGAAAIALDVGVRGGVANLFVAVGCGLVVLVLLRTDHRLSASGRGLLLTALLPITMLALRSSPWLAASNAGAIGVLVCGGVLYHRTGSLFDATPARWIRRAGAGALASFSAWRIFEPVLRSAVDRGHATQIGRGLRAALVAAPFVVGTVLLLQAGDVVFAELVTPDIDLGPVAGHASLVLLLTVLVVGLRTATEVTASDEDHDGPFGVLEVITMLGLACAVLVLFVASQLVAVTSVGDRLVRATGMTPAQYARSGFFQLCWATLAIVALLVLIRRLATPLALRDRRVRLLSAAVPILALGLVVVSVTRMAHYDDAFGMTMLRLWALGATVWLGTLLVLMAIRAATVGSGRRWVGGTVLLVAVALVLFADIVNPEAFVVRHNAARSRTGATLDLGYLGSLSDDAVPQIVETFGQPANRAVVRDAIRCRRHAHGVARFNVGVDSAAGVRRTVSHVRCGDSGRSLSAVDAAVRFLTRDRRPIGGDGRLEGRNTGAANLVDLTRVRVRRERGPDGRGCVGSGFEFLGRGDDSEDSCVTRVDGRVHPRADRGDVEVAPTQTFLREFDGPARQHHPDLSLDQSDPEGAVGSNPLIGGEKE
ncbi:MAG: DUF4173 domain-containing protein [Acidimicrobiia bacterium]